MGKYKCCYYSSLKVHFLCNQFLSFDWQHQKVTVSAAGATDICDKGNLIGDVCIMTDNGTNNSTSNVTEAHLKISQKAIKGAIPELSRVIDEALAGQLAR